MKSDVSSSQRVSNPERDGVVSSSDTVNEGERERNREKGGERERERERKKREFERHANEGN